MTAYAPLAEVHSLAAAIRRELHPGQANVKNILKAISSAPSNARKNLWKIFKGLRAEIHKNLSVEDAKSIEEAVSRP